MRDLRNIVNTRPIYARKLSNFAVVPHKRDVGLNWGNYNRAKTEYSRSSQEGRGFECNRKWDYPFRFRVVPHKRDVGLNIHDIIRKRYSTVVLHKWDVGLNKKSKLLVSPWTCRSAQEGRGFEWIKGNGFCKIEESFLTRGTWVWIFPSLRYSMIILSFRTRGTWVWMLMI